MISPLPNVLRTVLILLLLCFMSGCGQYARNRAADLADIFTIGAGVGLGATAQAGPAAVALFGNMDLIGIKGGVPTLRPPLFLDNEKKYKEMNGTFGGILIYFDVIEYEHPDSEPPKWYENRGKNGTHTTVGVLAPLDLFSDNRGWTYYTNFEASVGLGPSVRLGFNPGELLDFLLGWFGVDIAGDDKREKNVDPSAGAVGMKKRGQGILDPFCDLRQQPYAGGSVVDDRRLGEIDHADGRKDPVALLVATCRH